MRKIFTLFTALVLYGTAQAQYTTATVDGTVNTNEYGTQNNSGSWNITWDATNLYIGITTSNISEAFVFYIDKNPVNPANGGTNANGSLVGQAYDNTDLTSLPFRADAVLYVKNNYREYRLADGSNGWGSSTSGFGSYADNGSNTREVSIPWSAIGGIPASFNFLGYITSPGGFAYSPIPTGNPVGSFGTSATANNYYYVSTTANGVTTGPFATQLTAGTLLPITFGSINATQKEAGINVAWQILSQSKIAKYVIQKSGNGVDFTDAFTQSNTNSLSYNWTDVAPNDGNNFYRIKAVGADGDITYSAIVRLNITSIQSSFSVYPNPVVNNTIHLQLNNLPTDTYKVNIYNTAGQTVYTTNITYNGGNSAQIITTTNLAKGIYQLNAKGSQSNYHVELVIQ